MTNQIPSPKWTRKRNGKLTCGDFVVSKTKIGTYGISDAWGVIDCVEFKTEKAAVKWVEKKIARYFK